MRDRFRAIVIDDMDFCRDLLCEFLEERGYQVLSFPNVTSCPLFSAQRSLCPKPNACADFLLTDNRLPYLSGIDFLELLSQGNCHINTQCKAIFSAYWSHDELEKAKQLNCKTFHKPYNLEVLGKWLDKGEKFIPANRTLTALGDAMNNNERQALINLKR